MQPSRQPNADMMTPSLGWVAPARPADGRCPCGAVVEAVYREPVWVFRKPLAGSGCWTIEPFCEPCQVRHDAEQVAREAAEEANRFSRQVADRIASCGLSRIHQTMELENWAGVKDSARECVQGFVEGKHGLYIFGTPGTGKSHAAAGALKARIRKTGLPGSFLVVPELTALLRKATKTFAADDLIDALSAMDVLVLDDLGTERITDSVLTHLYQLIDRAWRDQRTGLVITSNLSLDEMAGKVGERLTSRIVDICKLVKLEGADHRLTRARNRP